MWQSIMLKDGTTLIDALFGCLRLWLYIYSIIKTVKHMKTKTSILEHVKFVATTVSLLSAWCLAMLWLLTINR